MRANGLGFRERRPALFAALVALKRARTVDGLMETMQPVVKRRFRSVRPGYAADRTKGPERSRASTVGAPRRDALIHTVPNAAQRSAKRAAQRRQSRRRQALQTPGRYQTQQPLPGGTTQFPGRDSHPLENSAFYGAQNRWATLSVSRRDTGAHDNQNVGKLEPWAGGRTWQSIPARRDSGHFLRDSGQAWDDHGAEHQSPTASGGAPSA